MKSQDNHSQQHYADSADCRNLQTTGAPHNKCQYFNGRYRWLTISAGALVLAPLFATPTWGASGCSKQQMSAPATDEAGSDACDPAADSQDLADAKKSVIISWLIALGDDVNRIHDDGETLLSSSAGQGFTECVRLLLDAPGIDVNKADKNGNAPLIYAAFGGHSECVKLLLAAPGIDVNKAANGVTPLDYATREGHTECARLIRAAGGK